jgi:hypothetical protein
MHIHDRDEQPLGVSGMNPLIHRRNGGGIIDYSTRAGGGINSVVDIDGDGNLILLAGKTGFLLRIWLCR